MIAVTERAKQELKRILSDNVDNSYAGLRLAKTDEGRISLGVDVEMPGDQVVMYKDSKVLLVESELATTLDGTIIDVEDNGDGAELVVCGDWQSQQSERASEHSGI